MSVAVDGHAGLARDSLGKSARCFLLLPKLVLVSYCFVVWVLYRVLFVTEHHLGFSSTCTLRCMVPLCLL